jgi:cytochrome c biogenesis protein CcmG/thiol:disulfide interchange protein DsbE
LKIIKRYQLIISILILSLGLVWIAISAQGRVSADRTTPAPRQGFPAPDFSLKDLNGQVVQLADFKGRAVLVNFWASWCPPCRAEMPAFQKIYREYEDQGL